MNIRRFTLSAFFISTLLFTYFVHAEPWLANRYAQNCASCHSPSRRNVEPSERRCTLSCQGCHVNPNGGGMRNSYGVWNQQRWLRSHKSSILANKGTPAPLKNQKYASMPNSFLSGDNTSSSKGGKKGSSSKKAPLDMATWNEMAKDGPPLVVTNSVEYKESDYDRSDRQEYINVQNRTEFLARITEDDPYRVERTQSVFAGGDFRYFMLSGDSTTKYAAAPDQKRDLDFTGPMALDLAVRVRPTAEKVAFVFEHRYFNTPTDGQSNLEWSVTGGGYPRSAYVLVDDLPYATYVQYGLYKPMFGHSTPDHMSLLNSIIYADNTSASLSPNARSAQALNKVLSIGGSPNVPFLNLHWIQPMDTANFPYRKDSGFAVNLGGRFVTLGASIMASYWSTKGPQSEPGPDLANDMYGVTGGFTYRDFVVNFDFSNVKREYASGAQVGGSDSGSVTTLETKYRIWREVYLMANYAQANLTRSLKKGSSTEMMFGVKSFLLPGTEFEILSVSREDDDKDPLTATTNQSSDYIQAQMHLFF